MAPSMASFETETTINVSQNAKSSPSEDHSGGVQVGNTVERVEDSVEGIPQAYRGGAVQPPGSYADDEDELYSVSPQAVAASQKRLAAAQNSGVVATSSNTPKATSQELRESKTNGKGVTISASFNVVDQLLARDATVHEPGKTRKRQSLEDADDEPDELQVDDGGLSAPIGSHLKSTKQPASQTPMARTRVTQPPSAAKTNPGAKGSALAALQARKRAQGSLDGPNNQAPAPKKVEASGSSYAMSQAASNLKTPRRPPTATTTESQSRPPTTGKLPSRKSRMLAQTPGEPVESSNSHNPRRKAKDTNAIGGTNDTAAGRAAKRRDDESSTRQGALKPPARAQPGREAKRGTMYDLSESPNAEESSPPAKKPRTAKATTARKPAKTATKPTNRNDAHQLVDPVAESSRKQESKSRQPQTNTARSASRESLKPDSMRARMKSKSESKASEAAGGLAHAAKVAARSEHDQVNNDESGVEPSEKQYGEPMNSIEDDFRHSGGDKESRAEQHDVLAEKPHRQHLIDDLGVVKGTKIKSPQTNRKDLVKAHGAHGESQDNAILLSDRQQSTSPSVTPSSQHQGAPMAAISGNAAKQAKPEARFPKTPRVLRSSPPLPATKTIRSPSIALVGASTAHKPTIVGFGKSGPLNQGSLSIRKREPGSATTNRSSVPPAAMASASGTNSRARLEARRSKGPPSATTSVKSYRSSKVAPPSNVAESVTDALAAFMKKPLRNREDDFPALSSPGVPPIQHDGIHVPTQRLDDDAELANIDDFDGPTLIEGESIAEEQTVAVSKVNRTISQVAMPPPAPKASKLQKPHRAPTAPSMIELEPLPVPKSKDEMETALDLKIKEAEMRPAPKRKLDQGMPPKRKLDEELPKPSALKRQRTVYESESHLDQVLKKPSLMRSDSNVPQNLRPLQQQRPMVPVPQRRVGRKPSRHASQGSQKVDIHGSPVPQGMVVPEEATVLETFSQQAGLPSDPLRERTTISRRAPGAPHSVSRIAPQDDVPPFRQPEDNVPPSRQPEIMSSNVKPVPAEPEEQSQAITRIVRTDPRRPLVEDQSELPSTDPFTSLEETRKQPRQGSSSSNFLEELRRHTRARLGTEVDPAQTKDPDKTLVEPERHVRQSNRNASLSTLSSTPSSTQSDESTASMRDLATWRNALQPHQMSLFDELVIVSHRLVQHLVDKETAATDIVDDYRRRGQNLVEQMELNHARQHQRYIDTLQDKKRQLRKEFNDCSKKLEESLSAVATKQRERKQAKGRDSTAEKLQDIVAQFC